MNMVRIRSTFKDPQSIDGVLVKWGEEAVVKQTTANFLAPKKKVKILGGATGEPRNLTVKPKKNEPKPEAKTEVKPEVKKEK